MNKPVLTVTLNPALDLNVSLNALNSGQVNKAVQGKLCTGGKGLNVAKVLRDLGHEVIATGFLGADNRGLFDEYCLQHSIQNKFSVLTGATRTNVKISEESGRTTDINLPGLAVSETAWRSLRQRITELTARCSAVVLAGSLPPGLEVNAYAQLIDILKNGEVPLFLDTSGPALIQGVRAMPEFVKPNREELSELCGQTLETESDLINAAQSFIEKGIDTAVVSDGAEGCYWLSEQKILKAIPPGVQVVSTVGAGDSLLAGLVHSKLVQSSVEYGLRKACAISAHAVEQVGVGIVTEARIADLEEQVQVVSVDL